MNNVFNYNSSLNIEKKVLLIDTFYNATFKSGKSINYINIVNKIIECFDNDIIIKPHPSEKTKHFKNSEYVISDIPFEILLSNSNNIENKVLVSIASTATVTPKLLFNKEPVVILLYNLLFDSLNVWNEYYDEYFKKIQKIYSRDRVYIPSSIDELNEILHQIEGGNI